LEREPGRLQQWQERALVPVEGLWKPVSCSTVSLAINTCQLFCPFAHDCPTLRVLMVGPRNLLLALMVGCKGVAARLLFFLLAPVTSLLWGWEAVSRQ
jgi:hypothetical protein